jgi:hypothetical protein
MTPNSTAINAPFTLTLKGTGFQVGANVQIGGTVLPMNVSTDQLATVAVPGTAVASLGIMNVKVLNPDGGQSGSLPLTVVNGTPVINTVTPSTITSGGPTFTMVLDGTGFTTSSVARWNGTLLATNYVSPTQIRAVVPASLFVKKGSYTVDVQNPAPGGGTSKTVKVTAN